MQVRLFLGLWIAAWLALVPGALFVWSGLGLPLTRHLLGATAFSLPLSGAPAVAALLGLVVGRKQLDGGRGLARWLTAATTFWVAVTAFPMQRMRFLKLEAASEPGGTVAVIAGFGALGSILCIVNGIIYFAEPRRGLRRAAVAGACAATLVLAIAIPILGPVDLTPLMLLAVGVVAFLGGQTLLLLALLGLAAARWVKAGFAEDRYSAPGTSAGGSAQS